MCKRAAALSRRPFFVRPTQSAGTRQRRMHRPPLSPAPLADPHAAFIRTKGICPGIRRSLHGRRQYACSRLRQCPLSQAHAAHTRTSGPGTPLPRLTSRKSPPRSCAQKRPYSPPSSRHTKAPGAVLAPGALHLVQARHGAPPVQSASSTRCAYTQGRLTFAPRSVR